MEHQAETMAKERRRELRAKAKAEFERSDDDEIVSLLRFFKEFLLIITRLSFLSVARLAPPGTIGLPLWPYCPAIHVKRPPLERPRSNEATSSTFAHHLPYFGILQSWHLDQQ